MLPARVFSSWCCRFPKSPLEFFDDYIVPSKPVIFREAAKGTQVDRTPSLSFALLIGLNGFKLWTDEYLARKYGKELVEVEEGKKARFHSHIGPS